MEALVLPSSHSGCYGGDGVNRYWELCRDSALLEPGISALVAFTPGKVTRHQQHSGSRPLEGTGEQEQVQICSHFERYLGSLAFACSNVKEVEAVRTLAKQLLLIDKDHVRNSSCCRK